MENFPGPANPRLPRVLPGRSLFAGDENVHRELRDWERISSTVRPHQTLGYLTPLAVPAAGFISMKGMKTVNHPLDEYSLLK